MEDFAETKKGELEEISRLEKRIFELKAKIGPKPVPSNSKAVDTQDPKESLPNSLTNINLEAIPLTPASQSKPNAAEISSNPPSNEKSIDFEQDLEKLEFDLQKKRSLFEGAKEDLTRKFESSIVAVTQCELLLVLKKDYHPHPDGSRGSNGQGLIIYFQKNSLENRLTHDGLNFDAMVHFDLDLNIISSIVAPSLVEFENTTFLIVAIRFESHRCEVLLHSISNATSKFLIKSLDETLLMKPVFELKIDWPFLQSWPAGVNTIMKSYINSVSNNNIKELKKVQAENLKLKEDLRKEKQISANSRAFAEKKSLEAATLAKSVSTLTEDKINLQKKKATLERDRKALEGKKRKLEAQLDEAKVGPPPKAQKPKHFSSPSPASSSQPSGHYLNISSSDVLPSKISFSNGEMDQ